MAWKVEVKEAAISQFAWFGKRTGRKLLQSALEYLKQDPLAQTRNMKSLRPNRLADRELRLFGKYRVIFSVEPEMERVTIILVGEKRGNRLIVSGKEFSEHRESDSAQ